MCWFQLYFGGLIIYASIFLIKRRNKEFGIYLTLGMSKRKMSGILFVETLIIGIISLFIGLGLGVILSQFMSVIVANMFEADMTKFTFVFSNEACIKTIIYFGIMYLLVMIFNTISIGKCKLIDLLYKSRKSEKLKLKNPYVCTVIFIISCLSLSYAYYKVTGGSNDIFTEEAFLKIIAIGAISTFFIFWSLSGLLIKIFTSLKGVYYRGLNSFTLRQFSSKINTMVFSMTIINLMLFITISLLASSFTMSSSMNGNLNKLVPVDIEFEKNWNIDEDSGFEKEIIEDSKIDVKATLQNINFDTNSKFKDITEVNYYKEEGFTLGASLGEYFEEISKQFAFIKYDDQEQIMTVTDYNKVAKLYGNETYSLEDNEYMVVADFDGMAALRNIVLEKGSGITINGKNLTPKYNECKYGIVDIAINHINTGIFIVPDNVVDDHLLKSNIMFANYNTNNKKEKQTTEDEINKIMEDNYDVSTLLSYNTRIDITEASVGLGAIVTFIGLYIGIIFLISSSAILALKELSESTDNIERFSMIRKLGADEKMINKALLRQIGIFFLFPLLIAIIHSIFGLNLAMKIIETFGTDNLLKSIVTTALVIIAIYGGYFIITYWCSKNIIKEK